MMWGNNIWGVGNLGSLGNWFGLLVPFAILDLVLKGFALWRAARNKQNIWFIALLIVNSVGILPAIYLLTHKEKSSRK